MNKSYQEPFKLFDDKGKPAGCFEVYPAYQHSGIGEYVRKGWKSIA